MLPSTPFSFPPCLSCRLGLRPADKLLAALLPRPLSHLLLLLVSLNSLPIPRRLDLRLGDKLLSALLQHMQEELALY